MENYYAVIMAGGGGTRLWPLSRKERPKQVLDLFGGKSLFQHAVDRISPLFPLERILIVTNEMYAAQLRELCPQFTDANFLLEPEPRGTAPAIGLAAEYLHAIAPGSTMAVLTADHYIGNESKFREYLEAGYHLAENDYLVTLGIQPDYPAIQYGYIQQGNKIDGDMPFPAFAVDRFKEKPYITEATEFLEAGTFTWNSGMFIWKVDRLRSEFASQMADTSTKLTKVLSGNGKESGLTVNRDAWKTIQSETIDYGIMERAQNTVVIPVEELEWNDVGSWNSLFEVLESDDSGNVILADQRLNFDAKDILVNTTGQKKLAVSVGVENLVVVDTGDVLLICSKERAQDIRQIVQLLKDKGLERFL
jgi:mannose-1-phosphate guanylyltransferase